MAQRSSCTYVHIFILCYKDATSADCHSVILLFLTRSQAQLDEQLSGLQTLVASRRQRLEESIKLHQYLRDVEELSTWLEEKQQVAASDDYGKDLDHLLMLQKKFDDFRREVANNTSRYTTVNNTGRKLIAEGESLAWGEECAESVST